MRSYASAAVAASSHQRCNSCGNVTASALSFFGGIEASEPCGNRQAGERPLLYQQHQYLEAEIVFPLKSIQKEAFSVAGWDAETKAYCRQRRGDRTRIERGRIFGYVKFFPGYCKLSGAKMRQKLRPSEQDCGIR